MWGVTGNPEPMRDLPIGKRVRAVSIPEIEVFRRVYHLSEIPRIAWAHLVGLLMIKRQLERTRNQRLSLTADS